jgi:nucleoside phosphorylase
VQATRLSSSQHCGEATSASARLPFHIHSFSLRKECRRQPLYDLALSFSSIRQLMARQLCHGDYTVGWVCALPVELAAAQMMLDEKHQDFERDPADNDENLYNLGSIRGHNVVIVCLPAGRIGNNPAAAVATQMKATFKAIRFGLMVGIGGGVPSDEDDIRLGDVVVSQPHGTFAGVVQYDAGKTTPSGFKRTGALNSPPHILLAAVAQVQANTDINQSKLREHIAKLEGISKFQRNKAEPDVLFEATYDHGEGQTCNGCSVNRQELRRLRDSDEEVMIHYGTIASGNQVMRSAADRDKVSAELGGVLCFEMEAAGLMNSFPCLVIRGVCDYADSHKNKKWQAYAAGTAAAYAKEVLLVIPAAKIAKTCTADEAIRETLS